MAIFSGIEKIMVTRPESGALKKICSRRVSKLGITHLRKHQTNRKAQTLVRPLNFLAKRTPSCQDFFTALIFAPLLIKQKWKEK